MGASNRLFKFLQLFLLSLSVFFLLGSFVPRAQVSGGTDVNESQKAGDEEECAIAKNPTNKNQLFSLCNNFTGGGLFAARSTNGGLTWSYPDPTDKTIADGDVGQGPAACCDPNLAWDSFGNLFITYLDSSAANVVTIMSTDGGATFTNVASFPGSVDQPTVVAANTTAPGAPVAVWIVWNQSNQMVARGAAVTGLGAVGAFGALQTIPGTVGCSFGDVAIAPTGVVVQACENPTGGQGPATIFVNTDADGLGAGNFGAAVTGTTTNVGGFDFIPAQAARSVDAEAGLAFDRNPLSPHFGRLYLMYTEETVNENNDTDIMARFSDNNGATWSTPPIRVNDDPVAPIRSQFMPKIASNPLSGNIAVCWYDARNSATNTAMQEFCSIATPAGATPTFMPNAQIGDGASTSNANPNNFGDYSGLDYFQGVAHPIWADTSNSTGDNPNGTANFDAYTDRVTGGSAAMEGDPHMTTVNGVHFDFQGGGEYVSLRSYDGLEIQTRETPIATTFFPGPDSYDGLATCVSLNTAVATRLGKHRVSYQPNISGIPDPSGLQLRVDGQLVNLGAQGIALGSDGRVMPTGAGNGIKVDFANGTILAVTPGWWADQGKWYLNVDVFSTPATDGIVGARMPGSWLPALPSGQSLGPMPADLNQRYDVLYHKFGDSWRVTDKTSLFDYAEGSSTKTFTFPDWPKREGPCTAPDNKPAKPVSLAIAARWCRGVTNKLLRANCIFDASITGERGLANTYLRTLQLRVGATMISISDDKDQTKIEEPVTFTAVVSGIGSLRKRAPAGVVQFIVDGERAEEPVKLDDHGLAIWKVTTLKEGKHFISATYTPSPRVPFLASSSIDELHVVGNQ